MADLNNPQPLTNYLVPAVGNIAGVAQALVASGTAATVDFSSIGLNGVPFVPQSVYVDNSQGIGPLVIYSQRLQFNCAIVPAGVNTSVNFPSVASDIYQITGNGQVSLVWSNAPALGSGEIAASISNIPAVTISGNPAVTLNPNAVFQYLHGQINPAGTTTGNLTPLANTNLRKLIISISENATLATAGTNLLTATLNGNNIYEENVYFPAAAAVASFNAKPIIIDFDTIAMNSSAGSLVVTIATALATGIVDVNAYFD